VLLGWLAFPGVAFAQPTPPGDQWLTNAWPHPLASPEAPVRSNLFSSLRAEVIGGKLKILWTPEGAAPTGGVTVHASAAEPAHWPTRDWRSHPMTRPGLQWQATLPVEDVEVPIVYFVRAVEQRLTNLSPLRVVAPVAVGLEEPTRVFWPFLEGFEESAESWRLLSEESPTAPLRRDPASKNGRAALAVSVPSGKRSATVATTRVRGWQLQREGATGLRVWLRAREGTGRARCTLLAHAFATNQVVGVWPSLVRLTERWQKVELPFRALPRLSLGAVDLFAIEFIADGPRDFLIDDLQLLGPWKLEPE